MPTVAWRGPTDQLLEMPDSPDYDLGRSDATCVRTYMGTHALAKASALPRGTIGTGDMAGWLVQRCRINRIKGGIGKLTITYGASGASSGQQLPPDEVGLVPFEVNPSIDRNRRYASLSDADFAAVDLEVKKIVSKPGEAGSTLTGMLLDLFKKKKRGNTHFYLAGFKYTWTRSYYGLTGLANVGGYLETPGGPLGGFIPGSFSCLRQADDIKWTGAQYKYTQSWLCGPSGHFDADLYAP